MLKIDSKMLVDSFIYEEFEGEGDYNKPSYKIPINVEKVRIDRSTVYSRNENQTQVLAEGIIFCYASATTPLKEFKEQSRVTFDGVQRIVTKVIPIKELYRDIIWAYELEVI
jgi:hypothetical protein